MLCSTDARMEFDRFSWRESRILFRIICNIDAMNSAIGLYLH